MYRVSSFSIFLPSWIFQMPSQNLLNTYLILFASYWLIANIKSWVFLWLLKPFCTSPIDQLSVHSLSSLEFLAWVAHKELWPPFRLTKLDILLSAQTSLLKVSEACFVLLIASPSALYVDDVGVLFCVFNDPYPLHSFIYLTLPIPCFELLQLRLIFL